MVRRLNPRDVPLYCGLAGVDVKIGLGRWAAQQASQPNAALKKIEKRVNVGWPEPPDRSTPGSDTKFGAGNGRAEARRGPVRLTPGSYPTSGCTWLGIRLCPQQHMVLVAPLMVMSA